MVNERYQKYKETLSDKIEKSNIPSNGFIYQSYVRGFINDRINDVEDCVIIKMKDVPEHMVGIDLTWLDREIGRIKDRLLNRIRESAGEELLKPTNECQISNHSPQITNPETTLGRGTQHRDKDEYGTKEPEDTRKGCGKKYFIGIREFTCGDYHYLCPACSGDEK